MNCSEKPKNLLLVLPALEVKIWEFIKKVCSFRLHQCIISHDRNQELHKRHGQKPRRGSRGGWHGHGRQFDRHSGALPDSERKIKKGWMGNSEESIESPVEDTEENGVVDTENETKEESLKTLDEYLAEKASLKPSTKMQPGRKPNEGSEDKWKNAVPLEKKEEFVLPVGNKVMIPFLIKFLIYI